MAAWLVAHKVPLGVVLLLLVSASGGAFVFGLGTGRPPQDAALVPAPSPLATLAVPTRSPGARPAPTRPPGASPVTVYIIGAVQHPGVYTADTDTRVGDLLTAAGGPTPDADLEQINLAARLHDEEQIVVPRRGTPGIPGGAPAAVAPAAVASPAPAGGKTLTGPVNINTADAAALQALPGIGPALAGRIVAYRAAHGPFARIDAIQDVSGIGPKLFARMHDYITVGP